MADPLDPKNIDKRLAERFLKRGQLDDKAYDKFLKSLPDSADKAAPLETQMNEDFDDEDDDEADQEG